ncbi:MAG: gliding motility lipoprotein GldB [Cytophagales bacterium]
MIRKAVYLLFTLFFLLNCGEKSSQKLKNEKIVPQANVEQEKEKLNIEVIRVDKEIFTQKTRKGIASIFDKYPDFSEKFLKRSQYPHDSILVNAFYQLATNKSIDSIYQISNEFYGDFYDLGLEFQHAFEEIKKIDPKFKTPKIYTIITGMGNDMFVNDSMIVIGLEFYLAEKCKYKPQLPIYMLKRYRKEYIVPMVMAVISGKYNESDFLDNSLIAEMVYFGKSYYFTEKVLPNVSDTLIAGYESEVLDDVKKNQKIIWGHFIEKKLLFETKNEITNRYIGERPTTFEIGNNCPGRIGRWLGWQIVKMYAQNNADMGLLTIMKEKDAKKILTKSKYKAK